MAAQFDLVLDTHAALHSIRSILIMHGYFVKYQKNENLSEIRRELRLLHIPEEMAFKLSAIFQRASVYLRMQSNVLIQDAPSQAYLKKIEGYFYRIMDSEDNFNKLSLTKCTLFDLDLNLLSNCFAFLAQTLEENYGTI